MSPLDIDFEDLFQGFFCFRSCFFWRIWHHRCHVAVLQKRVIVTTESCTVQCSPLCPITLSNTNAWLPFSNVIDFASPFSVYPFCDILVTLKRLKLNFSLTYRSFSSALISLPLPHVYVTRMSISRSGLIDSPQNQWCRRMGLAKWRGQIQWQVPIRLIRVCSTI